jgi:site-specific recombinase XerD
MYLERVLSCSALAADLAGLVRKPEGWLFARPDCNEPPDDRDLQQHVFRPAAEAAGVYHPGFGMHSMKRMAVTLRARAGASVLEIMNIAGHRDMKTTALYTVVDGARQRQILDGVWDMLTPDSPKQ